VKGKYEVAAWAGYFGGYEERHGMLIPMEGAVEWQLASGSLPYWKGRIAEIEYEFEQ
jgi:hypothetical protein